MSWTPVRRRSLTAAMTIACLPIGVASALAQVAKVEQTVPTPQQLQPSRQAPAAQARRSGDIFQAPEAGPCPLQDSNLTFTLNSVEFTGARKVDVQLMSRAYRSEIGKTLPVSAICGIRDRAVALLFSRGILARVEIPEQRIAEGKLNLEVIEAHVASVRFHGDAGPSQARVEAILEHLRGLTPFNLDTAQRYLLLASDIPGAVIAAAIRPSAQGRGAVDLDVTVSHRALEGAANFQNYGSQSLGREAVLGRIDLNGVTPLGDRTSLILYATADLREQRVVQLIEDLRPFDNGLIIHASASYARTKPGDVLSPLGLSGDSRSGQFALNYPLIRKRRLNLNILAGFDYIDEKTEFANNGGTLIDDKLRVVFTRAQADNRGSVFGIAYDAAAGVELRKGLSIIGASRKGSSTLSRSEGSAEAFVARADARLDLRPLPYVDLLLVGVVQDADRPLLTFEEVSIGNLTIGRGYDPSSVAGDRGVAGSAELRLGPFALRRWLQVSPYVFYDAAYVKYLDTQGDSATVHSAGGGVRISLPRVDMDFAYATPFDKPSKNAVSVPTPRVLATLTLRY